MESMLAPDQKWIIMIAVVAAITAVLCILMKRIINGKEGAAGHTNSTVSVSRSTREGEQTEGCDRDSLSSNRSEYDVFLSFRGPDARLGIVDHLYVRMTEAGLRVFKDDEEIRRGEAIEGELKRAIEGSRVYAVVFSRNYASSAWCLRELKMMVDLHGGSNAGGKIILPIFYKVDPADVKLRTNLYQKQLDAHKGGRHDQEVVKKWEEALKTVGGISGWDYKANQEEGKFVQSIVQDIFGKLRIKDKRLPEHLIGIDDRVSVMLKKLDCDSPGVRLVVLHGMGGIGKTTLACKIFNELHSRFEGSSFISNVRETSKGHGGIEKLQNKLLEDILGGKHTRSGNSDDEIIRRIKGKSVLLVLDDVDAHSQLERLLMENPEDKLGKGSRVIITTRDKSVCSRFVRPGSKLLHYYEMEKMDDNHALQLFSRRVFGTDEPPQDYLSLSKQVVKTTGNLPLALEVIGGHLWFQSRETWEYMLEKLKNIPHTEVSEILKVSYDGLEEGEKEIFLDIACFRRDGMPRRFADYLWEARDLYPKIGVKILINKSMIKIDSDGEFWIHDQLRDMGREIIRSQGLERPEMRTRLWEHDALKIVRKKKVSENIIAIDLHFGKDDEEPKLSDENFRGLSNLKYLHLEGMHQFVGNFGSIQETLVWLSWSYLERWSNPDIFEMSNLVVLKINRGWGSVEKLMMPKLRVLHIQNSDMITSPDLSCCLKLEIMVFKNCFRLKKIHHSVGKLERLTYMEISWCRSLRSLPKEICYARALRELIVTHCKIKEVPESIGLLESLRTLNLQGNKIRRLPATIGDLENLLVMQAGSNPLEEGIPEEIGSLSSLEELDLSYTNIRFLPATVSQLTNLKSLILDCCGMLQELRGIPTSITELCAWSCPLEEGIPDEIGNLSALQELDLSCTNIPFLPATVSQLMSLKSLKLTRCKMLQELPRLPTSITELCTSLCPLKKGIPEEIGSLSSLEELDLSYTFIPFLPATVSQLTSLKSLKLERCNKLEELPRLPTSLTHFAFSWKTVGLREEIKCGSEACGDKRIIKLKGYVELGILSRLKTLGLRWSLDTELEIRDFTLTEMELGGLDLLLPSLTKLNIWSSASLLRVSNIGIFRRGLKSLEFRECPALVEIPGLEQLEQLEELKISRCPSICGIQDLLGLKRSKRVSIHRCSSLVRVPRVNDECRLWIDRCGKLESFEGTYREYGRKRKFEE